MRTTCRRPSRPIPTCAAVATRPSFSEPTRYAWPALACPVSSRTLSGNPHHVYEPSSARLAMRNATGSLPSRCAARRCATPGEVVGRGGQGD